MNRCPICNKILSTNKAKFCKSHRPISEATRKKLSKSHLGLNTWIKGKPAWNKGKPAPWAKGENNPNWGKFGPEHPKWTGRVRLTKFIRRCTQYQRWRLSIFEKDNFTCQKCGKRGVYLEADHFPISFASILDKYKIDTAKKAIKCSALWNARGRTLCKQCHPHPGRLAKKGY